MKTPLDKDLNKVYESFNQNHDHLRETLMASLPDRSNHRKRASKVVRTRVFIADRIMRNRTAKLAAAAVMIIAVLVGVHQFGGSIDGTSVAWADVREAFLARPWVHLKYDNGTEKWYDLQNGRRYYKNWIYDGGCFFTDEVLNIRQRYVPDWGEHIYEDRPAIYKDGIIPSWDRKTAWEAIIGHWEQKAESGSVERIIEQVDGKQLIRFDRYYNDAVGTRLLIKQIWADPETQLPVKVWERLNSAHRKQQNREFVTGVFDFPRSGPSSIYDLGVPQELPIVRHYDKTADAFVIKVVEEGRAALERFPSRYRAIRWDNDDEGSGIEVVWRNGKKVHDNHYFNLRAGPYPEHRLDLPATAEEVLSWVKTQPPVSTYMYDGEKQYSRQHRTVFSTLRESKVRVMRTRDNLLPSSSRFVEDQWPYANRNPGSLERIKDVPEELKRYIGLRINSADIRRDFYIDPEHDHICVRWIWWKERSGKWEKEREYQCSGFSRLPQGQWYATKRVQIIYPDPERGTVRGGANWNIDVKVLEESQYPQDTFNGEKLLEGAKIETY